MKSEQAVLPNPCLEEEEEEEEEEFFLYRIQQSTYRTFLPLKRNIQSTNGISVYECSPFHPSIRSRALLKKLIVTQLVKNVHQLRNRKVYYRVHKGPSLVLS
jgi:hypothetical protein